MYTFAVRRSVIYISYGLVRDGVRKIEVGEGGSYVVLFVGGGKGS